MSDWRDRIIEVKRMRVRDIAGHPQNWREHPQRQREALTASLKEVGQADVLRAYYSTKGGEPVLTLWDGHHRKGLDPDAEWWIAITDLDDAEAALMLATFDPIAALAETNAERLAAVLADVRTGEAALQAMLADMAAGITPPNADQWADGFGGLPTEDKAPFQQMTFTLHDEQAERVKRAIATASKSGGDFADSKNQNGNGNALALICETFLTDYGQR